MLKRIISVVVGVIAGGSAVWFVENYLSHALIARPDSQFPQDPELVAEYITSLPTAALWMVVLAMFVGGFVASLVARLIAKGQNAAARDAGFIMLILTVLNLLTITHPTWMTIIMPLATIIGSFIALSLPLKARGNSLSSSEKNL